MDGIWNSSVSIVPDLLTLRKVVPTVGLTVLWIVESMRQDIAARPNRLVHGSRNVALTLLNALVIGLCFGTLTVSVSAQSTEKERGLLYLLPLSALGQVIVGVLLLDVWTWAWHHCNHRIPWLWKFHRVHHSDDAMDVTTAARFHVGELALSALIKLPFIAAFGIGPITLLIHETLLVSISQFHHAAISLGPLDRVLRLILVTPQMHQIHHSRDRVETNSNYASILSVWDRLFGTYRSTPLHPEMPTGLDEFSSSRHQSIVGMLRTPWDAGDTESANERH